LLDADDAQRDGDGGVVKHGVPWG
jgi:hypothetical protein